MAVAKLAPILALGAGIAALLVSVSSKAVEDKVAEEQDASPDEPNLLQLYEMVLAQPEAFSIDEIWEIGRQLEESGFTTMAENMRDLAVGLESEQGPYYKR